MRNDGVDSRATAQLGETLSQMLHRVGSARRRLSIFLEQGILFLLLVILLLGTFYFAYHFHSSGITLLGVLGVVALAFSIIAFLGWFLYLVHPWFRKWWVRISVGCILFVWGFVTFFYFPVATTDADDFTARILRATNRTSMTMFAKGRAYGKPLSLPARVNYGAFQTALILYVAAVLFSILGRTAMNGLQKILVWNEDLLHVFWGLSERDRLLAKSIHDANRDARIEFNLPKSAMYDATERARLTDLADELRAFWMFVNMPEPTEISRQETGDSSRGSHPNATMKGFLATWRKKVGGVFHDWLAPSIVKGCHHYFLGDDGHLNMAMAQRLADIIIGNDAIYGNWHFFVRAGDVDNDGLFTTWAEGLYEKSGHMIAATIIRDPELVARDFVSRFPPIAASCLKLHPESATVEGECRTLLLGFDRVGRELLNVAMCISGFVGPDEKSIVQFPFTVVDMKPERWERYLLSVPEIARHIREYGLKFLPMQVGMKKFESWFRAWHASFDRIIFCMSDDSVNIRECLRVCDILKEEFESRKVELFVRIKNPHLANTLVLNEVSSENVVIRTFGDWGRLYSYNAFHADEINRLAAAINWRWTLLSKGESCEVVQNLNEVRILREDLQDDIMRYWSSAPIYNQRSSRILALRCLTFCHIWGIGLRPKNGQLVLVDNAVDKEPSQISYDEFKKLINFSLHRQVLARMEHRRWGTYMRVCGYRSFNDAQDELCKLKGADGFVANQIGRCRRHAGLAAYNPECEEQVRRCEMGWEILADAAAVAGLCCPPEPSDYPDDSDAREEMDFIRCPDKKLVEQCAEFADIYPHARSGFDASSSSPAWEFLNSDEIGRPEKIKPQDEESELFWFEDLVSPRFDFRRSRQFRKRFAFVYNRRNGMIQPLDTYPREYRSVITRQLGINERLIDFKSQPHFVARVTRERVVVQGRETLAVVVSFCGTERFSRKDWSENIMQCLGFTPPQFRLAASLLKAVCETVKDEMIFVVGHSEGGGEVQYSLMRNAAWRWKNKHKKVLGYTFNSQRLALPILYDLDYYSRNEKTRDWKVKKLVSPMITNVRIESDIVSGCRKFGASLIGSVFNFDDIPGNSYVHSLKLAQSVKQLFRAHSLRSVVENLHEICGAEGGDRT